MVRLQSALQRFDQVNRNLLTLNAELESNLTARHSDLVPAQRAHHGRWPSWCRRATPRRRRTWSGCGATSAPWPRSVRVRGFSPMLDVNFIEVLEYCTPLHDIGKVGLPDHILMKPGKLDEDERLLMQRTPRSVRSCSSRWRRSTATR
jgi:response regulator RpfG family c-di-GMP phosphodiesterase